MDVYVSFILKKRASPNTVSQKNEIEFVFLYPAKLPGKKILSAALSGLYSSKESPDLVLFVSLETQLIKYG